VDKAQLYEHALTSFKIYMLIMNGTPGDKLALKWIDIAGSAITGQGDQLERDLMWMIYEPIRIIHDSVLERARSAAGIIPPRFQPAPHLKLLDFEKIDCVHERDALVRKTDEVMSLLNVWTGMQYPKLTPHLEASRGSHGDN
jgi:hypothetical protein